MHLTQIEQEMLEGYHGEALRIAMTIMRDIGEIYGAKRMIPITCAHIDGCSYSAVWDAGLEFAEKLAELGGRVSVPTTLNITSRDINCWESFRIPEAFAEKCRRMEKAYYDMGCIPTWTCAPYQYGLTPSFGEQVAWAESNAVNYLNSVIGARSNRYGDLVDICCALIGRVPEFGLHIKENRAATVAIMVKGIPDEKWYDTSIYAVLGYLVGELAGEKVPVICGIPTSATHEDLKAFSAASASSGAVGLFHIVGVTPEAPTLDDALQGKMPEKVFSVDLSMIEDTYNRLTSINGNNGRQKVDLVIIGCPHNSYMQFERIAECFKGRRIADGTEFWAQTNDTVYNQLKRSGLYETLNSSGLKLLRDGCILNFPVDAWNFKCIITNSGKMAHYAPGHTGANVIFRSLEDCIELSISGEVHV